MQDRHPLRGTLALSHPQLTPAATTTAFDSMRPVSMSFQPTQTKASLALWSATDAPPLLSNPYQTHCLATIQPRHPEVTKLTTHHDSSGLNAVRPGTPGPLDKQVSFHSPHRHSTERYLYHTTARSSITFRREALERRTSVWDALESNEFVGMRVFRGEQVHLCDVWHRSYNWPASDWWHTHVLRISSARLQAAGNEAVSRLAHPLPQRCFSFPRKPFMQTTTAAHARKPRNQNGLSGCWSLDRAEGRQRSSARGNRPGKI